MVVADKASQRAMEVANMSKEEGTVLMPTTILDPPEASGVEATSRTGKGNPSQNAGIVARKATRRASAGRSPSIQREPDSELGSDRTTLKVS